MRKQRWIKSITDTANAEAVAMPWQRGNRRKAFIAKRRASLPVHYAA